MANALWITLIGMGLVFVAILVLWGLMEALVRITNRYEEKEGQEPGEEAGGQAAGSAIEPVPTGAADRKRRAAAAAVVAAMMLSASQTIQEGPAAGRSSVSAWQAVQRARQIEQRYNISRKKVIR
jgi:Na+-transporting methylmalonyl-CoA/oxaloacetate decarboxylase gamma subunit